MGILAYARAFYQTSQDRLQSKGIWEAERNNFPSFLDEPLVESINATIKRLESIKKTENERRQERWNKRFAWLGLTLTGLALLYEFGGHHPIENARMACIVKAARENIFVVLSFVPAIYIFTVIMTASREIREWKFIRLATRIALAFPRSLSAAVLIVFGILIVPLGWNYVVSAALQPHILGDATDNVAEMFKAMWTCR